MLLTWYYKIEWVWKRDLNYKNQVNLIWDDFEPFWWSRMSNFLFGWIYIYLIAIGEELLNQSDIICYFTTWTIYRPGNGKFTAADIPADICTHVMYSFVGVNEDGTIRILDDWEMNGLGELKAFIQKRNENPDLKLILSMGGWNEGSVKFSTIAANQSYRRNLITSVINFLETNNFNGFDLDWEYPTQRGGQPEDVDNYITLLKELKQALQPRGYLLSAAASGGEERASQDYRIKELSDTVDFISVMTFDFHGTWEDYVGHNAPLYASSLDTGNNTGLNVVSGLNYWLEQGADPKKIRMAVPTYGRGFTLTNPNNRQLYAPTLGGSRQAPYTRQDGVVGYNEICELYKDYEYIWDDEQQIPHIVKGDQWIGFDNPQSMKLKVEFANSKGVGGLMVWCLDTDDFKGICGERYPLLNTMKRTLK